MNRRLLCAALMMAGVSLTAFAQSTPPGPGGNAKIVDCSKARNPERCQAREAARAGCQGKVGAARRQCMEDSMPPPDCSKAPNPAQCSAMVAAQAACKDKAGPERRQCMREQAKTISPAAKP